MAIATASLPESGKLPLNVRFVAGIHHVVSTSPLLFCLVGTSMPVACNAMAETFFKTIEPELVWRTVFYARNEAGQAIARCIDAFYNPVRRHCGLDHISPAQFERTASC